MTEISDTAPAGATASSGSSAFITNPSSSSTFGARSTFGNLNPRGSLFSGLNLPRPHTSNNAHETTGSSTNNTAFNSALNNTSASVSSPVNNTASNTIFTTNNVVTPNATRPRPTPAMLLSGYSLLSPRSKSQFDRLVNPTNNNASNNPRTPSPIAPLPDGIIFSASKEQSSQGYNHYEIHEGILDLARNSCHIPLTLFTATSTKILFTQDSTIKKIQAYHRKTGAKLRLIDLGEFPKEADMDISDWHEAWNRFAYFIEKHADASVQQRWNEHYRFLAGQDDFKINFPAILRFDIEQRTRYFTSPHIHNSVEYHRRFEETKFIILQEQLEKDRSSIFVDRSHSTSRPSRYSPYQRGGFRSSTDTADSPTKSFRPSRSDIPPICFICRRSHRYAKCDETTTADGKQTFAKRIDRQIVKRDGNAPICFYFNSSSRRCDKQHADLHICSFCGSTDHGAVSRKCT
jgi:hypothetical protein